MALDGIRDSRFGSAPTGVLAAQKGRMVMQVLLGPSWGACIKLLRDLRVWGPCVLGGGRLCHPNQLPYASARGARRTLEVLPEWPRRGGLVAGIFGASVKETQKSKDWCSVR